MKILVCVKQVPDPAGVRINPGKTGIVFPDSARFVMNRFDEYAVEEAVIIKENHPGTTVDVVTVGSESAEAVIRRAMGVGADNGFMVRIAPYTFLSPSAVSVILAEVAGKSDYDLIFAGIMSEDEMNAQTGQMLAARLGIPCATGVVGISFIEGSGDIRVEREREGGVRETLIVRMPALLTIQAGINRPRYPVLSAMLRANSRKVKTFDSDFLLSENAKNDQTIVRITPSEKMRKGRILEGTTAQKAKQLITLLKERNVLI